MIDYRVTGAIARITLNRPERRNAFNPAMIAALADSLARSSTETEARAVLITGAGPDFCTGMDVALLAETANANIQEFLRFAEALGSVYLAARRNPKPVVAAVRGRALGGGCGLATACDIVLAAESTQFGYPEVKIGYVPAIVMSMLRRSVGEKRAFELLVSGASIPAREALDIGLITRVYPDAEFEASVEEYVADLAMKPATAVSLTKKQLYNIDGMPFEMAMESGVQMNALARMTDDARQGFERFAKKPR